VLNIRSKISSRVNFSRPSPHYLIKLAILRLSGRIFACASHLLHGWRPYCSGLSSQH
jgi:hypothetical protein